MENENQNKPQTTDDLVNIIRGISFKTSDVLKRGESVPDINLKIQLKKLNESIKSYVLLMDNGFFVDAILIAGHIMETCSVIHYIKHPTKQEKNARKYVAKCCLRGTCDLLEFDSEDLKNDEIRAAFIEAVEYLKETGHLVIKKDKEQTQENNHISLESLKDESLSNTERIKFIKDNYDLPIVEDYLKAFHSKLEKTVNEEKRLIDPNLAAKLKFFYTEYCKIKHSNAMMFPGQEKGDIFVLDDSRFKDLTALPVLLCLDMTKEILYNDNAK